MGIVRKNLFESPDDVYADNLSAITDMYELSWRDNKAIAFGYYAGKMRVSKIKGVHGDIPERYKDDMNREDYIGRRDFKFAGRLWPIEKVISFWNYPSPKELPKVLNDIQIENESWNDIHIDFKDPNWSIEVIKETIPADSNKTDSPSIKGQWATASVSTLIPFSEYTGSANQSKYDQAKQHTMSPMNKLRKPDQSAYFNSRAKKDKPLAWKQALVKSESLKESLGAPLYEKLLMGEPVTIEELRDVLNRKVLNFEFIKLDGEVRPAKGTTMMKYIPSEEHPTGNHPSSDKVAAFYDLSKSAWRSVSNRSSEIVLVQDEETGKIKVQVSDKVPKEPTERKPEISKVPGADPRPILPKSEPIVKPSIRPETLPSTPNIDDIEIDTDPSTPLDIEDPNITADDVKDSDIVAQEPQEEPEVEVETPEPLEVPAITTPKPAVRPSIQQNEPTPKLPPKEDITFPDDEEEDEEEII